VDAAAAADMHVSASTSAKKIIICYRSFFNKDNTVSQYMIRETWEIDYSHNPEKQTIKKTEKVRKIFTPVFR